MSGVEFKTFMDGLRDITKELRGIKEELVKQRETAEKNVIHGVLCSTTPVDLDDNKLNDSYTTTKMNVYEPLDDNENDMK